jgi:hypothetical protein
MRAAGCTEQALNNAASRCRSTALANARRTQRAPKAAKASLDLYDPRPSPATAPWQWSKHRSTRFGNPRTPILFLFAFKRRRLARTCAVTTPIILRALLWEQRNRIGLVGPPPLHAIDAAPPTTMRGGWSMQIGSKKPGVLVQKRNYRPP